MYDSAARLTVKERIHFFEADIRTSARKKSLLCLRCNFPRQRIIEETCKTTYVICKYAFYTVRDVKYTFYMHPRGKFTHVDGDTYVGQWQESVGHGLGVYSHKQQTQSCWHCLFTVAWGHPRLGIQIYFVNMVGFLQACSFWISHCFLDRLRR